MPLTENRTVWPHADPAAAADHLADHNAMAAVLNAGLSSGLVKQPAIANVVRTGTTAAQLLALQVKVDQILAALRLAGVIAP